MTALLIAGALAASNPCAARFWDRDLGGLARLLADASSDARGCDRLFFSELSALVDCRPLAPLSDSTRQQTDRVLLRAEEARRSRLGVDAATAPTLWSALTDPAFFKRDTMPAGMSGELLVWPVESERWPAERVKPPPPKSRCSSAPPAEGDELGLLSPELLAHLTRVAETDLRWSEPLARAAYHRASRLLRAGDAEGARAAAESIEADALEPPLASFARLLRAELGLDGEEAFASLATDEQLGEARALAVLRAATAATRRERWEELLALTAAPRSGPTRNHLTLLHGVALARLGRRGELFALLRETFVTRRPERSDASLEALRSLGLGELAVAGLDDGRHHLLLALARGGESGRTLARFATRTLALGDAAAARIAAAQLASSSSAGERARGLALQAEIAASTNSLDEFESATAALLDASEKTFSRARERELRDRAALELGHALLTRLSAASPAWRLQVQRFLAALRPVLHERHRKELEELQRSAAAPARAALVPLGEVQVPAAPLALPPPPRLVVNWPEPYSLLAIPDGEGHLRAWFEATEGTEMDASRERTR